MENGPFTDDFPHKTSIYNGFSIAMNNYQRVSVGNHPPIFAVGEIIPVKPAHFSMGDLQDPNRWRYGTVPSFWPYDLWGFFP